MGNVTSFFVVNGRPVSSLISYMIYKIGYSMLNKETAMIVQTAD